ncbi:MAG: hypothetical protein HC915_08560 [Anaerolineae bacterium]|nr:hypothetical protein [Anaerolineae bacterium]
MSPLGQAGKLQRQRLQAEGVSFDAKERVDFRAVGWAGPTEDWLARHGLQAPRPLVQAGSAADDQPRQLSLL